MLFLAKIDILDSLSNITVDKDKETDNYLDASVELSIYILTIEQAIALCSVTDLIRGGLSVSEHRTTACSMAKVYMGSSTEVSR